MGKHVILLRLAATAAALTVGLNASVVLANNMSLLRKPQRLLDIPPDASSEEYQTALSEQRLTLSSVDSDNDDGLQDVLKAGERALNWIKAVNSKRDADHQLSFTNKSTRTGIPIDKPRVYNAKLSLEKYTAFLAEAPEAFKVVVTGLAPIGTDIPAGMSEDDYLTLLRKINIIYQISARWRLMAPNLAQYAQLAANDVRGVYFLSNLKDRDTQLAGYSKLPADQQGQIKEWLLEMCVNDQSSREFCQPDLDKSLAANSGSALDFYNTYVKNSQALYNSYFAIPNFGRRTDIVWNRRAPNVMTIPFTDPNNSGYKNFMLNVEDEWKQSPWGLKLNFVANKGSNVPHLEFQPGVTPHVNRIGGNIITMDANTPLSDWENGWVIRHEFGHVLGFPDCYVEFYQADEEVMINYQLDVTNLMCSRMGNFKQTHFDELKHAYYTN